MPEPQVKTLEIKSVNDKYKEASDKQKPLFLTSKKFSC